MKGKVIPIIIHHETDNHYNDYRDTYWVDCAEQAAKYNSKVVFIGKASQRHCINETIEFIDAETLITNRWKNFEEIFVDLAPHYGENNFSAIFFKRFFLMYEYCLKNNYDDFICLDSDLLVYDNFTNHHYFKNYDVALCIDADQFFEDTDDIDGLRWVANAGISYFKVEAIEKFFKYIGEIYTNHLDILQKKLDFHLKHNIIGGVTEMSLLYLWITQNDDIKFLNLAIENNGFVFNSDIWKERNYYKNEYKINKITNMKKIKFTKDNQLPIFYLKDGRKVKAYNIHFGGGAKKLMHDYKNLQRVSFKNQLMSIFYNVRKNIKQLMKGV